MKHLFLYSAAGLALASFAASAKADTFDFGFNGPGVSGNVTLTYGSAQDAKVPQGLEVTGISGSVSDTKLGIVDATISGLEAINHASPDPTNLLAPNDFSRYSVATGLADGPALSYDNLLYLGGSPQTASSYPVSGGFLDIYGLLFDITGGGSTAGEVVNFWSNGITPGAPAADFGIAFANHATALDYVSGGVTTTPEPATLCLLGTGALATLLRRRH